MIVLDTDVVSELMRGPRADPAVRSWVRRLDRQPVTTVINRAELLAGVALLPPGARRSTLLRTLESVLSDLRICLPFTTACSAAYADIVAVRTATGRPIAATDALIASVARVHGAQVATRDAVGFAGIGLDVVDPWTS